jgi:hypothetical protein
MSPALALRTNLVAVDIGLISDLLTLFASKGQSLQQLTYKPHQGSIQPHQGSI